MKIIHNENTENHISVFKKHIRQSEKVFIAVAFFKKSGLDLIISEIEEALNRKVMITIVCGLDFYQTEPEALKVIYSLSNQYDNCELLIHNHKKNITFHPKLFSFSNNIETHLIIGSANFTKGGFENNFEVSFISKFTNNTEQYSELNSIINLILKQAKEILEIIRNNKLTNTQFYTYYEQLVGKEGVKSLWHSGYLYRGKTSAKNDYLKFKLLLNEAYNNLDKKPEIIIKKLAEFYKKGNQNKIGSFGINKVTEILNTYKSEKFAVVNKNPLSSLKYFGFEKFPNPENFKPENYRDFNILISDLMNYCKFETLGQVDHFLNFIYWKM